MSKPPEVSVVIPSYNEGTYIDRLLDALVNQQGVDFEVIVSDAESKDETAKVVNSFKNKLNIKLVLSPPKGPAAGRNRGAEATKGEWLLFLDADDDLDDPNFIQTLLSETKNQGWSTSSAKIKVRSKKLLDRFGLPVINYNYIKLLAHTNHPVAPGWCILTKRSVFEDAKGYNEKIQFGEDYDYVSRAGGLHGFGFVDKTYYYVDLRRAKNEGLKLTLKGIGNEIYRHTHGYNLENNPIKYEFGKHKQRERD